MMEKENKRKKSIKKTGISAPTQEVEVKQVAPREEVLEAKSELVPVPCVGPKTSVAKLTVSGERGPVLSMFEPIPGALEESIDSIATLPRLSCNTCATGPECPEYKTGYVCAYEKAFKAFPSRDLDCVLELARYIVDRNKERLFRAMLSEQLVSGGSVDPEVTRLSEVVLKQVDHLIRLNSETVRAELSVSENNTGLLSRLFGGFNEEK